MPPPLQAKLLRVLENHEVVRIGSNETIEVDVRIVSATHQDLEAAAQEGRFREDLLYRLNGMTLSIPPLRERGADLELLVRHFVAVESANANRPAPMVEEAALKRLRAYPWPGNVRELQFVTRRAVQSCHGATILPEHFNLPTPAAAGDHDPDGLLRKSVEWAWHSGRPELSQLLNEMLERQLIAYALDQCEGNQTQVAQRLGISRNYLRKRIQELGLG